MPNRDIVALLAVRDELDMKREAEAAKHQARGSLPPMRARSRRRR